MRHLKLEPGWVLLLCALYYFDPMGVFWPFVAAVFCHELGHAVALWVMGVPILQLRLELAGAALVTAPMDYRSEILCALAGPAANLLLLTLRHRFPTFAMLSLLLAAFNLLPVFPLDGGRILRAGLLLRCDERTVTIVMRCVAIACGAVLLLAALWLSVWLRGGMWPVLAAAALLLRMGLCQRQEEN